MAEAFADEILEIGNEFEIDAIKKYGTTLKENCESFNIENVEISLKDYQKKFKQWSAL